MDDLVLWAERAGVTVVTDVDARKLTSFQSGGRVKYLFLPSSVQELQRTIACLKAFDMPYRVIGGGSNLLLPDEGFAGALIKLSRLSGAGVCGREVTADAGVKLPRLAKLAAEKGLAGLEFACGIPAEVGGATVNNAGAFGQMLSDLLEEVVVLSRDGEVKVLPAASLGLSYHTSRFPEGCVVLCAKLRLKKDAPDAIENRMRQMIERRLLTQPREPSVGSVFQRANGVPAALYVEKTGLKGLRIGGAELSTKHCNFIVNKGGATTEDFFRVAETVRNKVADDFGVLLQYEVERICSPKSN